MTSSETFSAAFCFVLFCSAFGNHVFEGVVVVVGVGFVGGCGREEEGSLSSCSLVSTCSVSGVFFF